MQTAVRVAKEGSNRWLDNCYALLVGCRGGVVHVSRAVQGAGGRCRAGVGGAQAAVRVAEEGSDRWLDNCHALLVGAMAAGCQGA